MTMILRRLDRRKTVGMMIESVLLSFLRRLDQGFGLVATDACLSSTSMISV